jgi:tetratricopeptide (TPR) repeat protein
MADVFLSYKREDRDKVRPLVDSLLGRGWSVWWDNRIGAGESWDQVIEAELKAAKCVLVVWSKRSIESDWVRAEAHDARDRRCLIPVIIDGVTPPSIFKMLQATDLSSWKGDRDDPNFAHVCAGIARLVPLPETAGPAPPTAATFSVAPQPSPQISVPAIASEPVSREAVAPEAMDAAKSENDLASNGTSNPEPASPPGRHPIQMLAAAAAALTVGIVSTYLVLNNRASPSPPPMPIAPAGPQSALEVSAADQLPVPSADSSPREAPRAAGGEAADAAPVQPPATKPPQEEQTAPTGPTPSNANENDLAILTQTRIIERNPRNADAYVARGSAHLKKGELDDAISDLNKAIEINSRSAPAFLHRGFAYRRKGDSDRAIAEYSRALSINPNFAEAYSYRGYVRNSEEDFASALADFNKAISISDKYAEAYAGRGAAYHGLVDYEAAIRDYTRAIELEPKNAKYFNGRGVAYHDRAYLRTKSADDFNKAIADYTSAIELERNFAAAYKNRGYTRRVTNDLEGAIKDYTEALRLNPSPDVFSRRGYAYELRGKTGDRALAEADYREAIKIDPTYETAKRNLKDLREKK